MTNRSDLSGVMLNAYPDSIGTNLSDILGLLALPPFEDVFSLFYALPTFFNSDLDRGFSVIDYDLNDELVARDDPGKAAELSLSFKFDLVLNHLSVNSPQFLDLLENGDTSDFKDFFIDWNEFWEGQGDLGADGFIIPNQENLDLLYLRKPGLPILMVPFSDGSERPYWNTFYQEVREVEGRRSYLGQMDLNAQSEKVWDFYSETLGKLHDYGAKVVRLDAFAYLHKKVGLANFFNKPGTWEYLDRLKTMADDHDLVLLPEIHAEYGTGLHEEVADNGFPIYDFFLPGLVIDALDRGTNHYLLQWMRELVDKNLQTVNMLGCHDGIPVLDLKGLLSDAEIDTVIENILERGGRIKNLYGADGKKIAYYQVNATYFSALGEDEQKLRLARAIQMFTPGVPQVWYLDLFAGRNDHAAADRGGSGAHKEINRTNLTLADIEAGLESAVVQDQLDLMRLRNTSAAFRGEFEIAETADHLLDLTWRYEGRSATLRADLRDHSFVVTYSDGAGVERKLNYPRR
ncbi:MAG: sucrose phosphorylase [bacterium]|nr:sucrose phosphorylase [bacterium]